ncbi:MAG: hypothetical protein ACI9G1_001037 [Pirellulaceae bacterium]
MDYEVCEFCGADLPEDAEFCRKCGASDEAGWSDDSEYYDDDDEFDDDEFDDDGEDDDEFDDDGEDDDEYDDDGEDDDDDDDFEYDEYISREFPDHSASPASSLRLNFVGIVALILVVAFLLPYIFSLLSLF